MTPIHVRFVAAAAAALLWLAPSVSLAQAPVQAPAPAAAQPEEELAEVVVHGKKLLQQIVDAEEEFYKLFNDVNKDDRYDTHCVYLQIQDGSRIQTRSCIPGFVADAMADWAPYKARCQPPQEMKYGRDPPEFACLDRNNDGRLSLEEASAREELASAFFDIDAGGDRDGSLSGEEFRKAMEERSDLSAPTVYMPPSPDAVLVDGTKRWYDHMTSVVNSDPSLHKMADHLGDLYHDLALAQRRYDELDVANRKKVKVSTGPRSH